MTTTPVRISQIEAALNSLLAQSRKLDAIYLFVPHIFLRDQSTYTIPAWLQNKVEITIVRCEDLGPATHMLQVLKYERDPQTYILQIDDDQAYGSTLVEKLLLATGPCPGRAIGAHTQHAYSHLGDAATLLEGVHGVLFQRKFFDPTVFDYTGFAKECWLHDDLWISAHLQKKGVRRESLGSRFNTKSLEYGFGQDALYRGGAGSENARNLYLCIASLLKLYPKLWHEKTRVAVAAPLLDNEFASDHSVSHVALQKAVSALEQMKPKPQILYLMGPLPSPGTISYAPLGFEIPGGYSFRVGDWLDGTDVFVHSCGQRECEHIDSLRVLLDMEEDSESLLIVLSESLPRFPTDLVDEHLNCHRREKEGPWWNQRLPTEEVNRPTCHGARGSISFKRLAAYENDRILPNIPMFGENFLSDHGWVIRHHSIWRDDVGPWKDADTQELSFSGYSRGMSGNYDFDSANGDGRRIQSFAEEARRWKQNRVVAVFTVPARSFTQAAVVFRSLMLQRPQVPNRIYVFMRGSVGRPMPAWVSHRWRIRFVGVVNRGLASPLLELLGRETEATNWVLHVGGGRRHHPLLLTGLLRGAEVWPGRAIACSGKSWGSHGGPIPRSAHGVLCRRSALDHRLIGVLEGPCANQIDVPFAAHLTLNGIQTMLLGAGICGRWESRAHEETLDHAYSQCHRHLITTHRVLWSSLQSQRLVLFLSLLPDTDAFLLGLTLGYVAMQTRLPDEVVLFAKDGGLLDSQNSSVGNDWELFLPKSGVVHPVAALPPGHAKRDVALPGGLPEYLGSLRGKVGKAVRAGSRSFLVSVIHCGGCSTGPMFQASFERELDPDTIMTYASAERLVNQRVLEDNVACISTCMPYCGQQNWCGQPSARADGALYDLTVRRSAGYRNIDVGRT
eukprot:gnl/MRDRNA2_/MRDRNA2_67007_c0_seq1.p1 gnl/MRDRNA2_/MRDRNA2_67007_c0~~gnl/MRDRNA2_/MRDRNA2_67007_c0_seq1.p1  ORF type:complete len:1001 (+),score=121.60 gnl/MRDRNA2_/MRDRNA2_67007_c0_seq1:302-3004(+)